MNDHHLSLLFFYDHIFSLLNLSIVIIYLINVPASPVAKICITHARPVKHTFSLEFESWAELHKILTKIGAPWILHFWDESKDALLVTSIQNDLCPCLLLLFFESDSSGFKKLIFNIFFHFVFCLLQVRGVGFSCLLLMLSETEIDTMVGFWEWQAKASIWLIWGHVEG